MKNMKTSEELRKENLLKLIKEAGGESALAEKYGCGEANIKTMARSYKDSKSGTPKGIGSVAARKLEKCMNKDIGWLDNDHSDLAIEKFRELPTEVRAWLMREGNKEDKPKGNGTK
jgi:hypothetical protein